MINNKLNFIKTLFIILIPILSSCSSDSKKPPIQIEEELSQTQIDSVLTHFDFEYENPIVLDSGKQIVIPMSIDYPSEKRKIDVSSYSSYGYSNPVRYWNVLFCNSQNSQTRLLTDQKFNITEINTEIDVEDYTGQEPSLKGKILYTIKDIDYNEDDLLDSDDPSFLYISETNGTQLKKISPLKEHLTYYKVINETQQIVFQTMRDTNQDSLFTKEDESIWYKTRLVDNDWVIKEMVDSNHRKQIKNLYFEQWLKKK